MSDISLGRRGSGSSARPLHAEIDASFPKLPETVRAWLAERPEIFDLLMQIEKLIASGELSVRDVLRLVKRWQENLPARRGEIVSLADFMQPEFELGLPKRGVKGIRPKRIRRRKDAGRKRS